MNEIEFQSFVRKLPNGTVVLLYREPTVAECAARDGLHEAAAHADTAGMLLTFIDPAKPLMVYRTTDSRLCIDFLHDAVYSADTNTCAGSCLISTSLAELPDMQRVWDRVSSVTGYPLRTRNQQYLAYAEGMLGQTYHDKTLDEHTRTPIGFLAALCSCAGIDYDGLSIGTILTNIQEDRYAYHFA